MARDARSSPKTEPAASGGLMTLIPFATILGFTQFGSTPDTFFPGSYVLNVDRTAGDIAAVNLKHLCLARFVSREEVSAARVDREPVKIAVFLDTFVRLSDSGKDLPSKSLVYSITCDLDGGGVSPKKQCAYLLGLGPTGGSVMQLLLAHRAGSGPHIRISPSAEWSQGLLCVPALSVVRCFRDNEPTKEDLIGTFYLSASRGIGGNRPLAELDHTRELLANWGCFRWSPWNFSDPAPQPRWVKERLVPAIKEIMKATPEEQSLLGWGLCAQMGDRAADRKCFDITMKLVRKGKWPAYGHPGMTAASSDELASLADEFSRFRPEFFRYLESPPSDKWIPKVISWLDNADSEFAESVLSRLASWAWRPDLEPKIAPKYVNRQPVILNRAELTKIWKENPPQIKRGKAARPNRGGGLQAPTGPCATR